ncbi:sugar ABC transporter permease [Kribbella sancticallisti]|uniref:Sugar ABC transporter permease n=1 Tax=Kribbella sancticallisti TaxID=460087 RepID=A0ABP4PPQ4_9ACTN
MRRPIRELVVAAPFVVSKAAVFGLFIAVPFVYTFVLTFQRGSILSGLRFNRLDNYRTIFSDTLFRDSLRNTLLFMAISTPVTLVVAGSVGLLLASKLRGMVIHRTLIYLPSLLSVVATGLIWKVLIDPEQGPLQLLMARVFGLEIPWLTDGATAIVFLALITAWSSCGFYGLVFMAGFNSIPGELLEAARIDGANTWQVLTRIKLPLIQPVMQVVLALVTINAVQVFDLVFVMTNGGPGTATYTAMWYVYQNAFNGGSVAYAATMSVILLGITAIISAAFLGRRAGVDQ